MNRRQKQNQMLRDLKPDVRKFVFDLIRERDKLKAEFQGAKGSTFSIIAKDLETALRECNGRGENDAELWLLKQLIVIHKGVLKERSNLVQERNELRVIDEHLFEAIFNIITKAEGGR